MDGSHVYDQEPIDHELSEDVRARVKSELGPGERLLWAARPIPSVAGVSGGFLSGVLIAFVFSVVGGASWIRLAHGPLQQIDGLFFFGLLLGIIAALLIIGLVLNVLAVRLARFKKANTLYALTDRRAIIWTPEPEGAVKVVSVPRGRIRGVHRVEYPDGSGDVIFKTGGPPPDYQDDYLGPSGFLAVADVRVVEEQLRRTLVSPPSGLSGSDDHSDREGRHGTGGSA